MRYFRPHFAGKLHEKNQSFMDLSLRKRMLFLGLPVLGCMLLGVFIIAGSIANTAVHRAISRNVHLQTQVMSHELERVLDEARDQLLILAAGPMDQHDLGRRLKIRIHSNEGTRFRELAFLGVTPESRFLLLNYGGDVVHVPMEMAHEARANPFQTFAVERRPGYVIMAQPLEVSYSLLPLHGVVQSLTMQVIRLSTPVHDEEGTFLGMLILSLDLCAMRDRLSLFASPRSPLAEDGKAKKRSMFFDQLGWILFQSEAEDVQSPPLSTDNIRSGLRGDFGRPGFSTAFRPNAEHETYWTLVSEVQSGRGSHNTFLRLQWNEGNVFVETLSYSPVRFRGAPDETPKVVGGVATLDSDFAATRTSLYLWGIYAVSTLVGLLALGGAMYYVAHETGKPIIALAEAIEEQNQVEMPGHLHLNTLPVDLERVRRAVDALLDRFLAVQEDVHMRQAALNAAWQRQPAVLHESDLAPLEQGIAGNSDAMQDLRAHIAKAASVFADVLVVGETGTGKEMASDAIHRQSNRSNGPFISINCGALDESLLMDTLFGHVKGAFTEARSDRKGAFLAAEGGTLMLDEIGNASPKVQQALLRALSTRRIRPLGSDVEIPFDVRIIAATNVDLLGESRLGFFREDLYYRLAVITIKTPPLREHKSDIPQLASHFLCLSLIELGRPPVTLSKGALDRLVNYDWPGNVRELKNTLTRALAFTEGDLIYAENIVLGDASPPLSRSRSSAVPHSQTEPPSPEPPSPEPEEGNGAPRSDHAAALEASRAMSAPAASNTVPVPPAPAPTLPPAAAQSQTAEGNEAAPALGKLNRRQLDALPAIMRRGSVTRQEYQELAGNGISMRTAQYDLQEMVSLGLMRKEGRGPALRYAYIARNSNTASV